jgi:hypothetical protein
MLHLERKKGLEKNVTINRQACYGRITDEAVPWILHKKEKE